VFNDQSSGVITQVRNITSAFNNNKGTTSKLLVEAEEYLKEVENKDRQVIFNKYTDLVEWLMLLFHLP